MPNELARERFVLDLSTGRTGSDFDEKGIRIEPLKPVFSNLPVYKNLDRNDPSHAAILRAYPKNRSARRQFVQTTAGILVFDQFGNLAMHRPPEFNTTWQWTCGVERPGLSAEKRDFVLLWEHLGRLTLAINTGTMRHNLLVELDVASGKEFFRTEISLMFGAFFVSPHLLFYDSEKYGLFDLKARKVSQTWAGQVLDLYPLTAGRHLALIRLEQRYEWRLHSSDWRDVVWAYSPQWPKGILSKSVPIEGGSIETAARIDAQDVRSTVLRFEMVYEEFTTSYYK